MMTNKSNTINTLGVECQIGMHRPYVCAKPRHFCTLDVATFKKALDVSSSPTAIDCESIEPLSVLHSKLKFEW